MKTTKILCMILLITILSGFTSYAHINGEMRLENGYVNSFVTEKSVSPAEARITRAARGRLLSSVTLQLSDEGNGVLGVYSDVLCHLSLKEIRTTIYLEIWNDAYGDWQYVNSYEYVWSANSANENLSMAVVAFDIEDLNRGREYRLRGLHSAKDFDGRSEMMSTETDGIFLD